MAAPEARASSRVAKPLVSASSVDTTGKTVRFSYVTGWAKRQAESICVVSRIAGFPEPAARESLLIKSAPTKGNAILQTKSQRNCRCLTSITPSSTVRRRLAGGYSAWPRLSIVRTNRAEFLAGYGTDFLGRTWVLRISSEV